MVDLQLLEINGGDQSTSSSSSPPPPPPRNPSPTSPLLFPHSPPPPLGYYAPPPPLYNYYYYYLPPQPQHPYYLPSSIPIHGGPHFPPPFLVGPTPLHKRKLKRSLKRNYRGKKQVWVPKQNVNPGGPQPLPPPPPPPPLTVGCTTVMVKNIPNSISRKGMIRILDKHCHKQNQKMEGIVSHYDFLYLPFDFRRKLNMGYAFVNFTREEGASLLDKCWTGMGWPRSSKKRLITPAKLQGLEKCKMHFSRSVFYCHTKDYLPVEFTPPRDGSNGDTCNMITTGRWVYRHTVNSRKSKWTPNHKANIPNRKMNIPPRQRVMR